MLIKSLHLKDYRNYSQIDLDLSDGLNIIIGPNGVGKTNILESMIILSNTRSFRTNHDRNLIKEGSEYCRIEGISPSSKYKVVISKEGKSLFIDQESVKRTSSFIGKVNCILFQPSDLELFSRTSKERRRILDIELGKISTEYLNSLLRYNLLLKDKNKILKNEKIDDFYFSLINEQMVDQMKTIISFRNEFFTYINSCISTIYQQISGTKNNITVQYDKCCEPDDVEMNLNKSKEKDLFYHYAVFGTHHDDFSFYIDSYRMEEHASQGQKRMAMISFKLALFRFITYKTKDAPVILLDDIFSELDEFNRQRLLESIPDHTQILITVTDIHGLVLKRPFHLIELKEAQ